MTAERDALWRRVITGRIGPETARELQGVVDALEGSPVMSPDPSLLAEQLRERNRWFDENHCDAADAQPSQEEPHDQ